MAKKDPKTGLIAGDAPEVLNVDAMIAKCLSIKGSKPGLLIQIEKGQVKALCLAAREVLLSEDALLDLNAPINVIGDLFGQYHDLLRFFDHGGSPPKSNYLFLGNYIDRGKQSLETICLLLAYKVKYPENIFLLRGNHECSSMSRVYGFYDECKRRYNSIKVWKNFCDVFNCMSFSALIGEKIFCTHGGLSQKMQTFEQVRKLVRPTDIPDTGLICDLLWSDPDKAIKGWADNDRGVAYRFGPDVVDGFIQNLDLDLVVRGHEVVEDGYEFFANRQLLTIFSAPNYSNEFDNKGAMMSIDAKYTCSFTVLNPFKKK